LTREEETDDAKKMAQQPPNHSGMDHPGTRHHTNASPLFFSPKTAKPKEQRAPSQTESIRLNRVSSTSLSFLDSSCDFYQCRSLISNRPSLVGAPDGRQTEGWRSISTTPFAVSHPSDNSGWLSPMIGPSMSHLSDVLVEGSFQ
jgi:hypothetical protein